MGWGEILAGYVILFNNSSINYKEYENFTDNELICKIRNGEVEAEKYFYTRYFYVVKRVVSSFFILGGEKDDLFQEAMIGLLKAVKNFNSNMNSNFKYYAELCMRRQIISAIRKSRGYEKNVLNNSVSIYQYTDTEYGDCIMDKLLAADSTNPEIVIIKKQEIHDYYAATSKILSSFEREVFLEYAKGKSYEEISFELKKDIKSIDNALQRIKKKVNNNKNTFFGS